MPACETLTSSIITYQGKVDDYLASDGKGTDVWAPDEQKANGDSFDQKFTGTITLTYNTNTGTINLDVNGGNGDIAYVKDTAGNVLYAADKTGNRVVKSGINTLRSSSVLAACVEPGKFHDGERHRIAGRVRGGRRRRRRDQRDQEGQDRIGAASLTFYGISSSGGSSNRVCTLAVPVRPPSRPPTLPRPPPHPHRPLP